MTLNAIETNYKGYKFRSRLEARWAVSFDEFEIKYDYEPEGFELPSKKRYLPDFFLPDYKVFVEIKPTVHLTISDFEKLIEFCAHSSSPLLFIVGTPATQQMWMLHPDTEYHFKSFSDRDTEELDESDIVERFLQTLVEVRFALDAATLGKYQFVYSKPTIYEDSKIGTALDKGKSARFEFGESG